MSETAHTNQYLTFRLASEVFSVGVNHVQEVLEFHTARPLPNSPDYIRGVINIRGTVVPVVDIRFKFGLGKTEKTIETSVIVMRLDIGGKAVILGVLADSVQEVVMIHPKDILPPPRFGAAIDTDVIEGIGMIDEKMILILKIDRIFESGELEGLEAAS